MATYDAQTLVRKKLKIINIHVILKIKNNSFLLISYKTNSEYSAHTGCQKINLI